MGRYGRTGKGLDDKGVQVFERKAKTTDDMTEKDNKSCNHERDTKPCVKGWYEGHSSVKKSTRRDSLVRTQSTQTKGTDYYCFLNEFDQRNKSHR